jgi:hypothetical protein
MSKYIWMTVTAIVAMIPLACNNELPPPSEPLPPRPRMMVVHASPGTPGVTASVDASSGGNLTFQGNSLYWELSRGNRAIFVRRQAAPNDTLIRATLDFELMKNYTVFAIDSTSRITAIRSNDDLTVPSAGRSHIRFFHLLPGAPSVNFVISSIDSTSLPPITVASGRAFDRDGITQQEEAFVPVNAGRYRLDVRVGSSSAFPPVDVTLASGRIYTVYAARRISATSNDTLRVITNN